MLGENAREDHRYDLALLRAQELRASAVRRPNAREEALLLERKRRHRGGAHAEVARIERNEGKRECQTLLAERFGKKGKAKRNWSYVIGLVSAIYFLVGAWFAVLALRL